MRTLTIISHTEHYRSANGALVGLASTVTEINQLLDIFDHITHVAMLHNTEAPRGVLPYLSDRITCIALPAVGGSTIKDKLNIVLRAPKILYSIHKALDKSDYFQFRAPTGMGVFVIPYLIFFSSKKGWFKYAGNWNQVNPPLAYAFQKWLLKHQSRKVTINGSWTDQPKQCLSFENPCLTDEDVAAGQLVSASKTNHHPIALCFVGRLETEKGMDIIIDALEVLDKNILQKIAVLHIVGEGSARKAYQKKVETAGLPIVFHGQLSREEVHHIYAQSHAILLPSASEGFPKVIAEAMNYGCLPIVSDVSSISQYVFDAENGFIMEALSAAALADCIRKLVGLESSTYNEMTALSETFMNKFTYAYYRQRLVMEIL